MHMKPHLLAPPIMWVLLIFTFSLALALHMSNMTIILEWTILTLNSTPLIFPLILDPMGTLFSSTVILISANVLSFSKIYMKDDAFINRFTIMVILFILSMNLLIYIPHFMALLLGWDGLGLVSFILVIYYQNQKSLSAGMITALSNRIGDAMLLIGIALTINQGHWLIMNMTSSPMMYIQILMILIAAMTKSAQMPFSSWLPAAMAAPTPVSALVHSSTLVTAGVFLLIRFYPFLHLWVMFNLTLTVIACMTMFMAGVSATTECDMKKIIALSTLSQLGLMMLSLGMNNPTLATFHMITHALFKALLFICAGSMINFHMHSQELRWMGNTPSQMPIIMSCFTIANMALCGFPFMAGFYSKDMIMEWMFLSKTNMIIMIMSCLSIGITTFYTIRFTLSVVTSMNMCSPFMTIDEPTQISTPTMIMSMCSTIAGGCLAWIISPMMSYSIIPLNHKMIPTLFVIIGAVLGMLIVPTPKTSECPLTKNIMSHYASCMMWYLVPMSSQFTMSSSMDHMHKSLYNLDHGWIESPQNMFAMSKYPATHIMMNIPDNQATITSLSAASLTALICLYMVTS